MKRDWLMVWCAAMAAFFAGLAVVVPPQNKRLPAVMATAWLSGALYRTPLRFFAARALRWVWQRVTVNSSIALLLALLLLRPETTDEWAAVSVAYAAAVGSVTLLEGR